MSWPVRSVDAIRSLTSCGNSKEGAATRLSVADASTSTGAGTSTRLFVADASASCRDGKPSSLFMAQSKLWTEAKRAAHHRKRRERLGSIALKLLVAGMEAGKRSAIAKLD